MLIDCPSCGRKVDDDARSCPRCGKPDPYGAVLEEEFLLGLHWRGVAAGRRDEEAGAPYRRAPYENPVERLRWETGYRVGRSEARLMPTRARGASRRAAGPAEIAGPIVALVAGLAMLAVGIRVDARGGWLFLVLLLAPCLVIGGIIGIWDAFKRG